MRPSEDVSSFVTVGGEGIEATVGGRHVAVGNLRMARRLGWLKKCAEGVVQQADAWEAAGGTVCWLGAVNGAPLAVFSASDVLRPRAKEAVAMLGAMGIRTVMCTGDNEGTAAAIAKSVGLTDFRAKLRPSAFFFQISRCLPTANAEGPASIRGCP